MKRRYKYGVLVILAGILSGCIPTWGPLNGEAFTDSGKRYSIALPNNWLILKPQNKMADVIASTDGPSLQSISVSFKPYKTVFEKTKVVTTAETLSFEMMEYYIAEYKALHQSLNVDVESREAVNLGNAEGFKVTMLFKNTEGLRFKVVTYGCHDKEGLYTISYTAPVIYYFDKNLTDFETSVKTFRLI